MHSKAKSDPEGKKPGRFKRSPVKLQGRESNAQCDRLEELMGMQLDKYRLTQ